MLRIITFVLLGLLTFNVPSQELSDPSFLRSQAIRVMANTPLLIYDKTQAMFIAEQTYQCAGYLNGMRIMVEEMDKQGISSEIPVEQFTELTTAMENAHITVGELIYLIYEVDTAQSVEVAKTQYQLAYDAIDQLDPEELSSKYDLACRAILNTYLPHNER